MAQEEASQISLADAINQLYRLLLFRLKMLDEEARATKSVLWRLEEIDTSRAVAGWLNEGGAGEAHEIPSQANERPVEMTDEDWNFLERGGWRTQIEKTVRALKKGGFPAEAHYLRVKNSELPAEPATTDERQAINEILAWAEALLRQPTETGSKAPIIQLADDAHGHDARRRHLNRAEGEFAAKLATLLNDGNIEAQNRGWAHANLKIICRDAFPLVGEVIQSLLCWCDEAAEKELRRVRLHAISAAEARNPYSEECATELVACIDRILNQLPSDIAGPPGRFTNDQIEGIRRLCEHQKAVCRTNHIEPEFSKRRHDFLIRVEEVLAERAKDNAPPHTVVIIKTNESIPSNTVQRLHAAHGSASEPNAEGNRSSDSTQTEKSNKKKRSTERGEGEAKLIAALTKHHKYADGSCMSPEPIGNNELARLAEVSESTASEFFRKRFKGHAKYRALCRDTTGLATALKVLNQEFSPHHLYGRIPPSDRDREDEE